MRNRTFVNQISTVAPLVLSTISISCPDRSSSLLHLGLRFVHRFFVAAAAAAAVRAQGSQRDRARLEKACGASQYYHCGSLRCRSQSLVAGETDNLGQRLRLPNAAGKFRGLGSTTWKKRYARLLAVHVYRENKCCWYQYTAWRQTSTRHTLKRLTLAAGNIAVVQGVMQRIHTQMPAREPPIPCR